MNKNNNTKEIGKLGEDLACKFLTEQGFEIIDRNYYKRVGEIDIIAFKRGIIHFFEVKTVSRETYDIKNSYVYKPEYNVSSQKIKKIEKTAYLFLTEKGFKDEYIQIDLLSIYLIKGNRNNYFIDYIPNINLI